MPRGLLFFCLFVVSVRSVASECGYQSPLGFQCRYELSELILQGPPYYQYNVTTGVPTMYELNICQTVTGSGCDSSAGGCQTIFNSYGQESNNMGKASHNFSELPEPSSYACPGVRLTYSDGTNCPIVGGQARQTNIDLLCSYSNTYIASVTESSDCHYHVVMYTEAACGMPMYTSSASPSTSMSASMMARTPSPSRLPSASASFILIPTASPTPSRTSSPDLSAPACQAFPITGLLPGVPVTLFGDTTWSPEYQSTCQSRSRTDWYSLKPSSSGNITITTCNSYTNFNTVLTLQVGACNSLSCFQASWDACELHGSTITWKADPSITYFIAVSGYQGARGKYELVVSFSGSADLSCRRAVHLPGPFYTPLRIQGTNRHAEPSPEGICGEQTQNRAVWYKFSPARGQEVMVSTCSSHTNFDTVLSIFAGEQCDSKLCVAANDNNCTTPNGYGLASTVRFTPTQESYYAVVYGAYGSVGNYQLYLQQIKSANPCESASVVALQVGTMEMIGNTTSASSLTSSVCTNEEGKAAWYYVTVTEEMQITIDTCSYYTNFDTMLSVYSGDCNNLSCVRYNDDGCGSGTRSRLTISRRAGEDFFVVVSGYQNQEGQFELTFTTSRI